MSKSMTKVLSSIQKLNLEIVDLKFTDLQGRLRHITVPAHHFSSRTFFEGVPIDYVLSGMPASAKKIDLVLLPDGETFQCDPFCDMPAGSILCNIVSQEDRTPFSCDTRSVSSRAEQHLINTGIADESRWGIQLDFQIFDRISYKNSANSSQYLLEMTDHSFDQHQGLPAKDINFRIRSAIASAIGRSGISVNHHCQIDENMGSRIELFHNPITNTSDIIMFVKYIIRMMAGKFAKSAIFLPSTIHNRQGNSLSLRHLLLRKKVPIFFEKGEGVCETELARQYIAGILKHLPSLMAFTNPSTNSYKRILGANIPTSIRILNHTPVPSEKQIELSFPDAISNPYLALSAILMAGLDGIKNALDPKKILKSEIPKSLTDATRALEEDHDFLLEGGVFNQELLEMWIEKKREEALFVERRVHPFEFEIYGDI